MVHFLKPTVCGDTARLLFSVTQGKTNWAPQDILATNPLPPQPNNELNRWNGTHFKHLPRGLTWFHYFILQAGVFMGFSITSAVLGGIIIICYSIMFATARYSRYYNLYGYYGYRYQRYSYSAKMALAAVILTLGIIEFGTGIWVSICLCFMKPCCTDSQVS